MARPICRPSCTACAAPELASCASTSTAAGPASAGLSSGIGVGSGGGNGTSASGGGVGTGVSTGIGGGTGGTAACAGGSGDATRLGRAGISRVAASTLGAGGAIAVGVTSSGAGVGAGGGAWGWGWGGAGAGGHGHGDAERLLEPHAQLVESRELRGPGAQRLAGLALGRGKARLVELTGGVAVHRFVEAAGKPVVVGTDGLEPVAQLRVLGSCFRFELRAVLGDEAPARPGLFVDQLAQRRHRLLDGLELRLEAREPRLGAAHRVPRIEGRGAVEEGRVALVVALHQNAYSTPTTVVYLLRSPWSVSGNSTLAPTRKFPPDSA